MSKHLAIFASGQGSNALRIIQHLQRNKSLNISLVITNNDKAGVLLIAKNNNIASYIIDKKEYYGSGESLLKKLDHHHIEGIVLAGFLWLVPFYLIEKYKNKILNIHPALLPKFGGKGMYGMRVHEAVWQHRDKQSGITIHEVNTKYDEGKIVFHAICDISSDDTPIDIAKKVQELEHRYYPEIIEKYFTDH